MRKATAICMWFTCTSKVTSKVLVFSGNFPSLRKGLLSKLKIFICSVCTQTLCLLLVLKHSNWEGRRVARLGNVWDGNESHAKFKLMLALRSQT